MEKEIINVSNMFPDGDHFVVVLKSDLNGQRKFYSDEGHTFMHLWPTKSNFSDNELVYRLDLICDSYQISQPADGELRSYIVDIDETTALTNLVRCIEDIVIEFQKEPK